MKPVQLKVSPQQRELVTAVRDGDVNKVLALLKSGVQVVTRKEHDYHSALYVASYASKNRVELANILLDYGADANDVDAFNCHLLHLAGNDVESTVEFCQVLLGRGAQIALVNAGPNPQNYYYGLTPLHMALKPEIAKLYLDCGADVNFRGADANESLPVGYMLGRMWKMCQDVRRKQPEVQSLRETIQLLIKSGSPTENLSKCHELSSVGNFLGHSGMLDLFVN